MRRVLAITNRKGGSGKTTTAVNLAAALSHRGKRVLLVDADPQAHTTISLGLKASQDRPDLATVLSGDDHIRDALLDTYARRLKLIPSSKRLTEMQRPKEDRREELFSMRSSLDTLGDDFDFIIFDTPPTLGVLTLSAMIASTEVYVPMQTHFLSLEGLAEIVTTIRKLNTGYQPTLVLKGVIPTFYRERTRLSHGILEQIRSSLGNVVLHQIRVNVALAEAPGFGQTIFQYDLRSNGAADYLAVARQIESR
jgi:chromosome partitioning protein